MMESAAADVRKHAFLPPLLPAVRPLGCRLAMREDVISTLPPDLWATATLQSSQGQKLQDAMAMMHVELATCLAQLGGKVSLSGDCVPFHGIVRCRFSSHLHFLNEECREGTRKTAPCQK